MRKEFDDQELTILAVNVRQDWERVARWVKKKRVTVPVLLDADGAVSRAYRVRGFPTVILVSGDGRLAGRFVGTRDWTGQRGRAQIQKLSRIRQGPPSTLVVCLEPCVEQLGQLTAF